MSKTSKKGGRFRSRREELLEGIDEQSTFWAKRGLPEFPSLESWKPTDLELPMYVLGGRLDYIPPPLNKVVKIFVSSTFTDMYVERNYLFTNIYKNLQQYCRLDHDLEFQVVDMRWGVRDEASLDHSGPKTCMDELRSCQELSLGPNFVCLLGQRYGNRPLQATVSKIEFDCIAESLEAMTEEERKSAEVDIELLKEWYHCDENGEPPTMILSPLNERSPPMDKSDFDPYRQKLHRCFRVGATKAVKDGKMTNADSKKYFWSVTEEEVYRGILSQENARDHTLCFQRQLVDIDYSHSKVGRFVELEDGSNKVNEDTTELISNLVEQTHKHLGEENFDRFDNIKWHSNGGTNEESLDDYLKQLGEKFEEKVKMLIKRAAEKTNPLKSDHYSGLLTEIAEHGYQALAKNKTFQGRDDIMNKMKQYILSRSQVPFIMYGESGFGKTSLLAVASARVYDWCGDTEDLIVVRRFLGTTPDSTNIGSLLASVTKQISLACRFKPPHTDDPMRMFIFTLISVPEHFRLVVFLDSLDQLSAYGKAHTLAWIPLILPKHVKLIVSTLPKDHGLLDLLKFRDYPSQQFIEVNILETELSIKLMEDWLRSCGRRLSEPQLAVVKKRFNNDRNTSPLYIKLIFDVVVKLRSYFDISELEGLLNKINSPVKCIRYIYEELMRKNGSLLVHRIFAYLHLSNLGLTENELVDLISLDDEVLNDVFQYHSPPLRRLPAVLWARIRNTIQEYIVTREANGGKVIAWYHRQFIEVGDTMYKEEFPKDYENPAEIPTPEDLCNVLRENMVNYFTGLWSGDKKKPFKIGEAKRIKENLPSVDNEAVRNVPAMPNILKNGRPNLRKLGQLPTLLIKLGRIEEFFTEVFGNIEGLVGLFSMYSWSDIYEIADGINFDSYKAIGKDKDEEIDKSAIKNPFHILIRSFLLTSSLACAYPKMLGPLVLGRLLPFAPGSEILNNFINGVYEKGPKMNSFVCPHVQLEGVGSYVIFEMPNDHVGSCVAMIEVTPKSQHYILTVSKKAVIINMEDGNIQMRYMPPDLRKDDRFNLVAAADPFGDPKEVAASLKIVPKIYIFSLTEFDIGEIIDCRTVAGYEEMRILGLQMVKITNVADITAVMVHGDAHDGLLMFDIKRKELLFRFKNDKMILFLYQEKNVLTITQPQKHTTVLISKKETSSKPDQPKQQQQFTSKDNMLKFTAIKEERIFLPSDSIITAKARSRNKAEFAFGTEDGNVYYGIAILNEPPKWTKILLDSPATDIEFPPKSDGESVLGVCTKHYSYILVAKPEDTERDMHEISSDRAGLSIVVAAKINLILSKICVVDDSVAVGYHLGQVYIFKLDGNNDAHIDLRLLKKFDAHSRPITGIIVNEDIAAMVLTAAEDGSVRVFHAGLKIHPLMQESYTFDRMAVPIHKISASPLCSTSLSTESNSVAVWSNSAGKITKQLAHEDLSDGDTLTDVVCFDDAVVTVTMYGMISFWDISQSEPQLIEQISVEKFQKITRGCAPYEVLPTCTNGWHKFNSKTGEMMSEMMYEDREILKVQYVKCQLSLLQRLLEEEELVVEVITKDSNATTINLSTDKDLDCGKLQDFFCCDHILVLLYPRKCIFYNWDKREVLQEEKVNKPILISAQSNTFILRSNCSILSYKINLGLEKLNTEPMKLAHKDDQAIISPDGRHVIVIEQKKMLSMYRVGDLKACIGQYSLYGELERVVIASDCSYIVCGIADTRLFYLMLCDVEVEGHHERALNLQRTEFTDEQKKIGKLLIDCAATGSGSEEDIVAEEHSNNINTLEMDGIETCLSKVEGLMMARRMDKGCSAMKALRSSKRKAWSTEAS